MEKEIKTKSSKKLKKKLKKNGSWYPLFWSVIGPYFCRKFGAKFERHQLPEGGNLILANHVTNCDQFLLAVLYKKQLIHFVAGENAFRNHFLRWLVEKLGGVIIHMRGVSSFNTIKQMTARIKNGENVCIFPEGTTTFSGKTARVDDTITKVAKTSGGNLVLCRIEGGYFSRPRWGNNIRKGRADIIEYVVTKEEIASKTVAELTELINEKLYTDAYLEQKEKPVKFLGKHRALGLESCLYQCPKCKAFGTLKTEATTIWCCGGSHDSDADLMDGGCGFKAELDEYGILKDEGGTEYSISELCEAQRNALKQKVEEDLASNVEADGDERTEKALLGQFLFGDTMKCKRLDFKGREKLIGEIKIKAFTDRIEYAINDKEEVISYSEVMSMHIYLRNTINIRLKSDECCYELVGDFSLNALKYRDLLESVRGK